MANRTVPGAAKRHLCPSARMQDGKHFVIPYVVYEKVWPCNIYPPDGIVTFRDIYVECDGRDCTQHVRWTSKVPAPCFPRHPAVRRDPADLPATRAGRNGKLQHEGARERRQHLHHLGHQRRQRRGWLVARAAAGTQRPHGLGSALGREERVAEALMMSISDAAEAPINETRAHAAVSSACCVGEYELWSDLGVVANHPRAQRPPVPREDDGTAPDGHGDGLPGDERRQFRHGGPRLAQTRWLPWPRTAAARARAAVTAHRHPIDFGHCGSNNYFFICWAAGPPKFFSLNLTSSAI